MNKTLMVASYELRKTARKKAFVFITMVVPALLVIGAFVALPVLPELLGGLGNLAGFGNNTVGYVDRAGIINATGNFLRFDNESGAMEALKNGNVSSYFVVPADYPNDNNVTIYTTGTIEFVDPRAGIMSLLRESLMRKWGIPESRAELILNPYNASVVKIDSGGAIGSSGGGPFEFALPYGFAMLLLLTIMMSSSYLMQGIGEEKENKTGELLLSSISADQLLRGKVLGYGSLGLFQALMYAGTGILIISISPLAPLFSGLQLSGIMILGMVYFLLGYALFASSIAATASISSSVKEAQQTSTLFTLMAVIPIIFITFIVNDPNSSLAQALTLIPYTSPFVMLMRMSITTVPPLEIAASIIILIVAILVMSKLASRIFRMGMLKYGSRAGLREVLGFIREK